MGCMHTTVPLKQSHRRNCWNVSESATFLGCLLWIVGKCMDSPKDQLLFHVVYVKHLQLTRWCVYVHLLQTKSEFSSTAEL